MREAIKTQELLVVLKGLEEEAANWNILAFNELYFSVCNELYTSDDSCVNLQ